MRARKRLMLDVALLVGLVAIYKPTWTGITWHEWLSIAVIVPLLLHFTINWEWAVRVARTFIERLLHASRLNFVIDCLLMVATSTAMVSGFMVTPWLLSLFHIHPSSPFAWHVVHSAVANVTITLLLIHTGLHWRFLFNTTKKLVEEARPPARRARTARVRTASRVPAAARAQRLAPSTTAEPLPAVRRSRVGVRAAEAARERAMALRVVSVLGLAIGLCVAISAGVGMAGPLFASSAQAHGAKAGKLVCPKTGCAASSCHAGSGMTPAAFYARAARLAEKPGHASTVPAKPRHARTTATASRASSKRSVRKAAAVAAKPAAKKATSAKAVKQTAPAPKPKPATHVAKRRSYTCPATGCTRSSCHATAARAPPRSTSKAAPSAPKTSCTPRTRPARRGERQRRSSRCLRV